MKQKFILPLTIIFILSFILSGCSSSSMMNGEGWPGLTVAEDAIYISYGSNVRAADLSNGSELWHYPDESKITFFAEPAVTDDLIIVGDYTNTLHALDRKTGVEQWAFTGSKGRWVSGVIIVNDTIYAPNTDHQLYILDLDGKKISSLKMDEAFWAKPITDGKVVFLSSMDHHLYAVNTESNQISWKIDLGGALVTSPSIDDGILYIGTLAKEVYAIDSSSGQSVWKSPFTSEGSIWASILSNEGVLYFGDATGNFYALDAQSGKQIWKDNIGSAILASAVKSQESLLVPSQAGEIYQFDMDGKNKIWATVDTGSFNSSPVISQDTVVVAVNKSEEEELLIAYDLDGRKLWSSGYEE